MICEKCGKEMQSIHVNMFDHEGADSLCEYYFQECEEDAVVIDTNQAWVGYELSEEEQLDTIECPHCHQFPFKNTEIQVYDVVRIVCFKTQPRTEKKKLTYEEFLAEAQLVEGHTLSEEDFRAMYEAYLDDDAEDRE